MNLVKRQIKRVSLLLAGLCASVMAAGAEAAAVPVTLEKTGTGYTLLRDGKPYFILGAGGGASKQMLRDAGGNSFRTWGADDIDDQLDEAQKLGLTVTVGIWLGHERHGFDYNSADQVARQYQMARDVILKYKDHPAVLAWALGNEMEGYEAGDNAAIWSAINNIASMAHQLDPNHPTMTVIAEIGGNRVKNIHRLCPDIDIVGINSYAGGPSLADRYIKEGGTKPFVITEYGPPGTWEVGKNAWDVPIELTSTAKADAYRATYEKSILAQKDKLCLGGYAFTWGNKQEATATWFGLFLPDGQRLEAMDTLSTLWTGKSPVNRCPQIKPLTVLTADKVDAGQTIRARVDVTDPEGDPLKIQWRLTKDYGEYGGGGDAQITPPSYPDAIQKQGEKEVTMKMPADGGGYWLYAIVQDNHNGAAVADVPLYVNGTPAKPKAAKATLPFVVYEDGMKELPYIWSGWMGNYQNIGMDEKSTDQPHSGKVCMRIDYKAADGFGGIVWQSPANDWGEKPGGRDLTGAKKLTFWARGQAGGEKVDFKLGVIGDDKPFHDSASAELAGVVLTSDWKQYTIDLAGKDLSCIKTGFVWLLGGQGQPVTFFLDDIQYE